MRLLTGIRGRSLLLTVLALLAAALLAPVAQASTYTVDTFPDGNDQTPGNDVCFSATAGGCSFRAAVQEANAHAGDDTIDFLPSGTFTLSPTLGHIGVGTSSSGNLTINGQTDSLTVLDAGGNGAIDTVLLINASPATTTVRLNSLSVQGVNSPGGGGGIVSNGGNVFLSKVTVTGNTGGSGAGIDATAGTLTVSDSTVSNNTNTSPGAPGGGIESGGAVLSLTRSTVTANTTTSAGGAGVFASAAGSVIANSTIAANSGSSAIRSDNSLTIVNSTISTSSGEGVEATAPVSLGNAIVSSLGASCDPFGTPANITSAGHNIATDGTCSPGSTDKPSTNPQLAALADNDGPTQTMAITSSSPAFDAGSPALCAASPVSNVDQRGLARPQFAACDIGAFELRKYNVPVPGPLPDNSFKFGKLRLKSSGKAILPVKVPGAGVLRVHDSRKRKKLILPVQASPTMATTIGVSLRPTSHGRARFRAGQPVKTTLKVTFTPTMGAPNPKLVGVKLFKK